MKKSLFIYQLFGFVFTGIVGVLLHFLFNWTNQSIIVAPFSAVNESIWEHMKLLFFPMFAFAILENHCIENGYKSFWCVKLIGILMGISLIPIVYYTINKIFGNTPDWVNILIFYTVSAISYTVETRLLNNNTVNCKSPKMAIGILLLIVTVFVVLTFIPPEIPLFEDPITKTYGLT